MTMFQRNKNYIGRELKKVMMQLKQEHLCT